MGSPGVANTHAQSPTSIGPEEDTVVAQVCQAISDLENLALSSPPGSSEQLTIGDVDSGVTKRADDLQQKLQLLIEKSLGQEGTNVDELLALNDSLTNLLTSPRGTLGPEVFPIVRKLSKDKGTGLTVNIPSHNGFHSPHTPPPTGTPNGHLHESPSATDEPDEELSTPRLDKGKQRAAEEPKKPTPVLRRPSLVLDSEDEAEPEVHPEAGISPTVDRSVVGNLCMFVSQLDIDPNILAGLVAGSKKRVRSSVKAQSSSAPKRWKESMRARNCERRLAPRASQPKFRSNLLTVSVLAPGGYGRAPSSQGCSR